MSSSFPDALDVDPVAAVDHHLRDGVVLEQLLERAVADDVVDDLAHEPCALVARQRRAVAGHLLLDRLLHPLPQVAVGGARHPRPQFVDHCPVHAVLHAGVRVAMRRACDPTRFRSRRRAARLRAASAETLCASTSVSRSRRVTRYPRPDEASRRWRAGALRRRARRAARRRPSSGRSTPVPISRCRVARRTWPSTERANGAWTAATVIGIPRLTAAGTSAALGSS